MRTRCWPLLAVALLACGGCRDTRRTAEETARQVGVELLRREAATFYKLTFATPPTRILLPKPDRWPMSFRQLKPLRVRAYPDGFAVAIIDRTRGEEGFYIVPLGMERTPRETRGSEFQRLDDGFYWYRFGD